MEGGGLGVAGEEGAGALPGATQRMIAPIEQLEGVDVRWYYKGDTDAWEPFCAHGMPRESASLILPPYADDALMQANITRACSADSLRVEEAYKEVLADSLDSVRTSFIAVSAEDLEGASEEKPGVAVDETPPTAVHVLGGLYAVDVVAKQGWYTVALT